MNFLLFALLLIIICFSFYEQIKEGNVSNRLEKIEKKIAKFDWVDITDKPPIDVNIILGDYSLNNKKNIYSSKKSEKTNKEISEKNKEIEKENKEIQIRNIKIKNRLNPFEKSEFPSINLNNYPKESNINDAIPGSYNMDRYNERADINIQKTNPYEI